MNHHGKRKRVLIFLIFGRWIFHLMLTVRNFSFFSPQDLKNLDSKLKALDNDDDEDDDEAEDEEMDDEEEEEEEIVAPPPKKAKKSAVDDKFFSLSEMEKFLNEQEANGQMSDIDDDDNDDEDFETDYRYKDFFEESAPKK